MKIISYNVNGIRAVLTKKTLPNGFRLKIRTFYCLQETKSAARSGRYNAFLLKWVILRFFIRPKKGYSGVAILTKNSTRQCGSGDESSALRCRRARNSCRFWRLVGYQCVYSFGFVGRRASGFQNGFSRPFCLLSKSSQNTPESGSAAIIIFVINPLISIILSDRTVFQASCPKNVRWLDRYEASSAIDSFRVFDQSAEKYSWWSYPGGARFRNAGWRIDYHWVSEPLRSRLKAQPFWPMPYLDHCPVTVELD